MSMETPLRRVRGLGSAKAGTEHFWHQRLTGFANLFFSLFLIIFMVMHIGASRADVVASLHHPLIAALMLLSIASILWHMKLGLQVVIEDYVHRKIWLILALIANAGYCALLGALALYAIGRLSLGV